MIKGKIDGQSFALNTPIIVSDTIDYLSAQFEFSDDWNGTDKWAHFAHRSASRCEDISVVYDVKITDNKIDKGEHLNLTPGMWSVYIHGTRMENGVPKERITTNDDTFGVVECGLLEGEPLPLTPMSAAERILAMIGDLGELTLTTKTDIVSALNEVVSRIGSGGTGSNPGSTSGKDGVSVTDAEVRADGHLWITFSNGNSIDAGYVKGERGEDGKNGIDGEDGKDGTDGYTPVKGVDYFDGKDGKDGKDGTNGADGADGVGIREVKQTTTSTVSGGKNVITVYLTNGSSYTFTVYNGQKGADGTGSGGGTGIDGVSVDNAYVDDDGHLIVELSTGELVDAGYVVGTDGKDGTNGADGKTPVKGTDYWTASDKAEMVSDVLSALPTWNGGSY